MSSDPAALLFVCRRFHCRLSVAACVARQSQKKHAGLAFPECQGCEQGAKNREQMEAMVKIEVPDPQSLSKWGISPTLSTEVKKPETTEPQTIVCRRCEKKLPEGEFALSARSKTGRMKVCRKCQGALIAQGHARKSKKEPEPEPAPRPGPIIQTPPELGRVFGARIGPDAVILDFIGRDDLRVAVAAAAADQERTITGQVYFWLRQAVHFAAAGRPIIKPAATPTGGDDYVDHA